MVSLREQRACWLKQLERAGAFAPAFELCELIRHASGLTEAAQRARDILPEETVNRVNVLVDRRCAGEPLQYLVGEWEFYGLPFYVGEGVLIPRADTETLVDAALQCLAAVPVGQAAQAAPEAPEAVRARSTALERVRIADLCSGTGCVAVALAKCIPAAQVFAVELSAQAYAYLTRNIARNKAANVVPIFGDVLAEQAQLRGLDLIVSNPPYIATGALGTLAPEVRREPRMALDGRKDGLYFYRELVRVCAARLKPGGWLAFECGDDQAPAVRELLRHGGYNAIGTRRDLEGFERVVFGKKPE